MLLGSKTEVLSMRSERITCGRSLPATVKDPGNLVYVALFLLQGYPKACLSQLLEFEEVSEGVVLETLRDPTFWFWSFISSLSSDGSVPSLIFLLMSENYSKRTHFKGGLLTF